MVSYGAFFLVCIGLQVHSSYQGRETLPLDWLNYLMLIVGGAFFLARALTIVLMYGGRCSHDEG